MFLAAQDMRDAEIGIVGAGGHVVGRHAGRAQQREILEVAGRLGHGAVDEIRHDDFGARLARHAETEDERFAGVRRGDRSLRG